MKAKLLLSTLALCGIPAAPAAARPADVNVVNTVSVAGTVGIDPAANLVRIKDTVPVAVANGAPIPVSVAGGERVQFAATAFAHDGESSGMTEAYTVPAGNRLEIESVTVDSLAADGVVPVVTVGVHWIDQNIAVIVPMTATDLPDFRTQWLGTAPVKAVTDSFVRVGVQRMPGSSTAGNIAGRALVVGRLVAADAPAP